MAVPLQMSVQARVLVLVVVAAVNPVAVLGEMTYDLFLANLVEKYSNVSITLFYLKTSEHGKSVNIRKYQDQDYLFFLEQVGRMSMY